MMHPVNVTITDEVAYAAYLGARSNGLLHAMKDSLDNLSNVSLDSGAVEEFNEQVDHLCDTLIDSGLLAHLAEEPEWVAEYKVERVGG